MTSQTLKLKEIEKKKLKEVFQIVISKQVVLTIQSPDGEEIIIQPKQPLKKLPVLEGYVPDGWKDAIYQ